MEIFSRRQILLSAIVALASRLRLGNAPFFVQTASGPGSTERLGASDVQPASKALGVLLFNTCAQIGYKIPPNMVNVRPFFSRSLICALISREKRLLWSVLPWIPAFKERFCG